MSGACGTADAQALVVSLIRVTDCQAAALGSDGWHALSSSGLFAGLLTGLLTIAVAWHGYRLLAGPARVAPHEAVALLVRIGVVIALATSWQAYDRLIYRVATQGPAEIARATFPSAGIDTANLEDRLQNAYDAIHVSPEDKAAQLGRPGAATNPELKAAAPVAGQGATASGRNASATLLLVVGAGAWIATRFVLALLLAIGPLAAVAMLFEASAGLAVGWLRALIGTALAAMVVPLALALELQMLEGPVRAAALAGADEIDGLAPIVWIFALVTLALVVAAQRIAGGLRLPRLRAFLSAPVAAAQDGAARGEPAERERPRVAIAPPVPVAPSRALAIAQAAEARAGGRHGTMTVGHVPPSSASTHTAPPTLSRRGTELVDHARRSSTGRRTVAAKRWTTR